MFVYMQVDKISDVGREPRQGWMLLEHCTFGFCRKDMNTGNADDSTATTVRAVAKPITITKLSDRGTTALASWLTEADPRGVQIEFCIRPGDLYLVKLTLGKAQLRSYKADFNSNSVTESFQINYQEIELKYWEQGKTNEDQAFSSFVLSTSAT